MKPILNFSLKESFAVFVLTAAIAFSSCDGTAQTKEEAKTKQKGEAPQMDIHMAIMMNNLGVVKKHIEYGTDLNAKEPMGGSTPLMTATVFNKPEAAKLLIEAGSDLNVKNNDGATALHVAAFFCRTEIVEALLARGADKEVRNNFGATPFESVAGPWNQISPIYSQIKNSMKPMGLEMDLARIEKTRPVIADLLK